VRKALANHLINGSGDKKWQLWMMFTIPAFGSTLV